jgi:predicted Zn-dependent protease
MTGLCWTTGRVARGSPLQPLLPRLPLLPLLLAAGLLVALAACSISHRKEVEIGAVYAEQIDAQLPVVRVPEIAAYLQRLGDSLASIADTRGLDWRFTVVNLEDVNAFALPGGYVYVTRALVDRAATLDQLAGVLAHEISHVTRRHAVKQIESVERANVGLTLVCVLTGACQSTAAQVGIEVGGAAIFAKYSRDDERQADQDGVRLVVRAGVSPLGIPAMLETLLKERRTNPGGLDAWFRTHPYEEERIAYTRSLIAEWSSEELSRLTTDTPLYRDFRARVQALPPAAKQR